INSIFISRARRSRAGLSRPVMQPVRRPAVFARVSPWPSCASKVLISNALPSLCESKVTLPSVMVPSTSIRTTLIWLARFFNAGEILTGLANENLLEETRESLREVARLRLPSRNRRKKRLLAEPGGPFPRTTWRINSLAGSLKFIAACCKNWQGGGVFSHDRAQRGAQPASHGDRRNQQCGSGRVRTRFSSPSRIGLPHRISDHGQRCGCRRRIAARVLAFASPQGGRRGR